MWYFDPRVCQKPSAPSTAPGFSWTLDYEKILAGGEGTLCCIACLEGVGLGPHRGGAMGAAAREHSQSFGDHPEVERENQAPDSCE